MGEEFERALATGIKTEKDSIEMYRKAAANTANPLGKALFETLVKEEQGHLRALEEHVGKENWEKAEGRIPRSHSDRLPGGHKGHAGAS